MSARSQGNSRLQGRAFTMPHSSAVKQLRAEVCRSLARPGGISASSYGSRNLTDMSALCDTAAIARAKARYTTVEKSESSRSDILRSYFVRRADNSANRSSVIGYAEFGRNLSNIIVVIIKKAPHAGRFFHTLSGRNSKTRSVCYTYCSSLFLLSSSATLRSNCAIRSSLVGLRLAWRSAREASIRALMGA